MHLQAVVCFRVCFGIARLWLSSHLFRHIWQCMRGVFGPQADDGGSTIDHLCTGCSAVAACTDPSSCAEALIDRGDPS